MKIVINTLGRVNNQPTLNALTKAGIDVSLVVQDHEKNLYGQYSVPIIALPPHIKNLPDTRQWMLDNLGVTKLLIIDDDFTFFKRKSETDWHLVECENHDIEEMITAIDKALDDGYAVVGISMRQGNNRKEGMEEENTAINGLLGIRVDLVNKECVRFDVNPAMEDKHLTLGMLTKGYKNLCFYKWCYNQPASNTGGGCSTYRTADVQKQAAELLHATYPDFVTVKIKTTKGGWFGGERHDVICYWKKAYKHGLQTRSSV